MTTLPLSVQAIWHVANAHGRAKYLAMKAMRRHPWQYDPAYGADLPDTSPLPAAAGVSRSRAPGSRARRASRSPPWRGRGP